MCDFCNERPKVVLNGKVFPQCGRTCRDKAKLAEEETMVSRSYPTRNAPGGFFNDSRET
ncbi:hypothetical protein B0H34DRAFT_729958 [Crassisporium funariophilum]|nr:hypothetical protein B0H34DRAFT_729958 [Crassisporium funariophilum]